MICRYQTMRTSEILESKDNVLALSPVYDLLATQRLINDLKNWSDSLFR